MQTWSVVFLALSWLAALSWGGLLLFRAGFWRADQRLVPSETTVVSWPSVVAVIPARNEAAGIGDAVGSLLDQRYAGDFRIMVVDDDSQDGTADVVRSTAVARDRGDAVSVLAGTSLPPGWTGKTWAMAQGVAQAEREMPEARYLLLTDADIVYEPEVLSMLVARAEGRRLDLVSVMAWLRCKSGWERLLIPAFVFFFQKLYPFAAVNDPSSPVAAAAGGCMLVRREALAAAGGIEAIRDRVIDDCALGRNLKRRGPVWLGLSRQVRSIRPYEGLGEIWRMVARTAYVQLDHNPWFLLGTVLAMTFLYLLPPLAAVAGIVGPGDLPLLSAGVVGWGLMAVAYRPTLALYDQGPLSALTLPAAALLYTLMTVDSARRTWLGRGGAWKGRAYAPRGGTPDGTAEIERFVAESGSSFYLAMRMLSVERRKAMFAIYAFCRKVDDVADEGGTEAEKLAALAWWREEVDRILEGQPSDALGMALANATMGFDLHRSDFLAVIDGMEMDARERMRAPTLAELDLYCDRVASAVGRLSNRVFGLSAADGNPLAHELGRALQLTNILRDVGEDAARGRLYLPREFLERHGVPLDPEGAIRHPALPLVCADLATLAEGHFAGARAALARCDRHKVRPPAMMMAVYRKLLERLIQSGWQPLTPPVALTKLEKLAIAFRHVLF
ncbi:MAG: presqualene diphosphate synthase HpnD [Alphaproteobacteria bacterium]